MGFLSDIIKNLFSPTTTNPYAIPEKYNEFPRYNGSMIYKPTERETAKYSRVTMRYPGAPSSEFISSLYQAGFIQETDVRYGKGNTYVIVDDLGDRTEIVYHIKKSGI